MSPVDCELNDVLQFLWDGFEKKLAVSTLRSQWAAIKAFRNPWGNLQDKDELVSRLLRSFSLEKPVVKPLYPFWDLPLVLKALTSHPFEPLHSVDLKFLTLKVVFLIAITSARRIGELGALMAREPFVSFFEDGVILRPDHSFVPKVASSFCRSQEIILPALREVSDSASECQWHLLDVARALKVYLDRTSVFRKTESLFVLFGAASKGEKASLTTLSRWIKQAISLAYSLSQVPFPFGVQGRSTRLMSTS